MAIFDMWIHDEIKKKILQNSRNFADFILPQKNFLRIRAPIFPPKKQVIFRGQNHQKSGFKNQISPKMRISCISYFFFQTYKSRKPRKSVQKWKIHKSHQRCLNFTKNDQIRFIKNSKNHQNRSNFPKNLTKQGFNCDKKKIEKIRKIDQILGQVYVKCSKLVQKWTKKIAQKWGFSHTDFSPTRFPYGNFVFRKNEKFFKNVTCTGGFFYKMWNCKGEIDKKHFFLPKLCAISHFFIRKKVSLDFLNFIFRFLKKARFSVALFVSKIFENRENVPNRIDEVLL